MAEFIPTGLGGFATRTTIKPALRRVVPDRSKDKFYEREALLPPPRPRQNIIPSPEAIESLIERALAALSKGIYWDRGSIINIVL